MDRDKIIRENLLLAYCQARGWNIKRDGAAHRYKCLCPFHNEKTPSFTIYADENRYHCFGCGADGSVIDLHMALRGINVGEVFAELSRDKESKESTSGPKPPPLFHKLRPCDPFKDKEKIRLRTSWPPFEAPTQAEIEAIAAFRSLSPESVTLAAERGLLFCADFQEGRAWVITDSRRKNAQARRMDGAVWTRIGGKKAWTLPGSIGALPIGLYEALAFPNIAFVEGGPDLLAALHLAWCATSTPEILEKGKGVDVLGNLGVVAMFGVPLILDSELHHFKSKRVRIFADADKAGQIAKNRWWRQLKRAGATVDSYSLTGFLRFDGKPVKDLNDFALIDPDQWEAERDAIEEAFSF
jgi:hypothetical protein